EISIIDSLLARTNGYGIFDERTAKMTVREKSISQKNGSMDCVEFKTLLTVRHPSAPFLVNESIAYFWGPQFLPDNSTDDCINLTTSTSAET
ncbi:hypothetical protein PFISCL1PPCAC_3070, partial [Pristionchus fissidentatus]